MTPLIPSDSVDALIAKGLPGWMSESSEDALRRLHRAIRLEQALNHRIEECWRGIPALDEFAQALLERALSKLLNVKVDARHSVLRVARKKLLPTAGPRLSTPITARVERYNLLTAALHNFHEDECVPSIWREGRVIDQHGKVLKLSFERFAYLCRTLDIGARYQRLLRQHFQLGGEATTVVKDIHELQQASLRARLEVAVRLGQLRGEIDERTYLRMLPLCAEQPIVPADPARMVPRQLYLLGKRIHGVVTVEAHTEGKLNSVIAWLPNEPQAAVQRHASWDALYQALSRKLRSPGYLKYFTGFIAERDRIAFLTTLNSRLAATDEAESLDGRNLPIDQPLLPYLRQLQVDKWLDDARILAVSSADVDEQDRRKQLDGYKELGLDLLGLAGLFVPALGAIMLAVTAGQLCAEVYEGYEAWQIGDRQAALDHLFGVAENVLAGVALTAGAQLAGRALQRFKAVDGLAPVCSLDGRVRLCRPDLPGYAVAASGLDTGQLETVYGMRRLRLPQATYEVDDAAEEGMCIRHPSRAGAPSVFLEHNEVGGWRHELEAPHSWAGAGPLLRRLGRDLATVTDELADSLLLITGYDEAGLRRLHLEGGKPPARLLDALERYQLHQRVASLDAADFEAQLLAQQKTPQRGVELLRRDFPGLTPRCAGQLLRQAEEVDVQRLLERQRVPLRMAEQARWYLGDSRLDRACTGLLLPQAVNADTERLTLALLHKREIWPASTSIRLIAEGQEDAPLATIGPADALETLIFVKGESGYWQEPADNVVTSFLEALIASFDETQRESLGGANLDAAQLGRALARQASEDREEAARLIGLAPAPGRVRPPRRLGDGRLGYPLSGRGEGGRQALRRGLRQIFPTFTDQQLDAYLADLAQREVEPWGHYAQLRRQLLGLRASLQRWQDEASGVLMRLRRRRAADRIRRCWRRKSNMGVEGGYVLHIDALQVGTLPDLPVDVSFAHVTELTLRGMALEQLPDAFLRRFTGVVEMDASRNELTAIPSGLEQLTRLRQVDLRHNRIVIDSQANERLASLPRLERLNLSHNPLGQAPALAGLPRLRNLSLRNTGLQELPSRAQQPWRALTDFRDNQLRRINMELQGLRERLQRMVVHDNPLESVAEEELSAAQGGGSEGPSESSTDSEGTPAYRRHVLDAAIREHWLAGSQGAERMQRLSQWDALVAEPGSRDFFRFLGDFAYSTDMLRRPRLYRARVWAIIEACIEDTEIREALFVQAGGPRTCEDRVLWILSQMESRVLVVQMTRDLPEEGAQTALVQLGRSLWRLDQVDRIAARQAGRLRRAGVEVDEIEVFLTYRVNLAGPLQLPPQPATMHYESHSGVGRTDINAARLEVQNLETPRRLSESLANQTFWEDHVRRRYRQRFEDMLAPFYARLAVLEENASQTGELAYLQGSNTLRDELLATERRLIRTLAREAHGLEED